MPNSYKVAGQAAPAANTDVDLYVVPATKSFVSSSIVICNRNVTGVNSKFRIAVVPSGGTLSNQHYLIYDQFIEDRDTIIKTIGISLATGDKVVVRSDSADLSFTLFGSEIS
jgi:hypothetical protein